MLLKQGASAVAISADSRKIATSSQDKTVKVWDARMGKLLQTLTAHSGSVTSLVFLADNRRLVTGSEDKTAKIWDSATGTELQTLK